MDNLSLEKKVHAAIIKKNVEMEYLNIEVPEKGSVHITGLVSSDNDRESIQSALEAITDVTDVHIDVSAFSGHY
jgi:osmotically-inducible protein OsmY